MRTLTMSMVLAGLLVAAAWSSNGHAAEDRMTKDQLYSTLENMGYSVQKKVNGNDYDIYLNTKSGDLTLSFFVSLSGDNTKIWFMQNLATVTNENAARVPWQKILAANNTRTGSCMFEYYEASRTLYLDAIMDNRAVKASDIRTAVDRLAEVVAATRDLWDEKNWTASNTVGLVVR